MGENLEKICGLICAYNEQGNIAGVIKGSRKYLDEMILVDDGSRDRTAIIALEAGAKLLQHGKNSGKGSALKTGFDYFFSKDFDAIVTLDGDGQHLPEDIPRLVAKLKEGFDAVIAKRDFRSKNVPFTRKIGNLIDSYILSKLLSADIYDAQNGFRAFRRGCLSGLYNSIKDNGFPYEAELVAKMIRKNISIGWVDVAAIYSKGLESKIKPFKHTIESFKLYGRCLTGRI